MARASGDWYLTSVSGRQPRVEVTAVNKRGEDPSEGMLPAPGGGCCGMLSPSASFSEFSRKPWNPDVLSNLHIFVYSNFLEKTTICWLLNKAHLQVVPDPCPATLWHTWRKQITYPYLSPFLLWQDNFKSRYSELKHSAAYFENCS